MNTDMYVWLYSSAQNSADILADVQDMFASMERRLSRFNPHSELSRLNQASNAFTASPTLFAAIEMALWAAEVTGGLFDPTILSDLERAGYDRSFESIARLAPLSEGRQQAQPGRFRGITLNRARHMIYKDPALKIDLGGIGKGWTVDRTADRLLGLGPFLINAGGDLYAYGLPPGEPGWRVTISHPFDEDRNLATLRLENRAVATSSITRRRWHRGGVQFHHLIDPRTALPAETDLLSVTVTADRVVPAEVWAKVALIIGSAHGLSYLESAPDVEGLLVTKAGEVLQTSGLKQYFEHDQIREE